MNQDETIALFRQGKDAWNAWAEAMLAERRAMEADGRWQAWRGGWANLEPQNDATRDWMHRATADFSARRLVTRGLADAETAKGGEEERAASCAPPVKSLIVEAEAIEFSGWIFPGGAEFGKAQFHGGAEFGKAQFHGGAGFGKAQFHGEAGFGQAQFHGEAEFGQAQFHGEAGFGQAQFHGGVGFGQAQFHGKAEFGQAQFHRGVWFKAAQFHGVAWFGKAPFHGEAWFGQAQFHGLAGFEQAEFHGEAGFAAAQFHGDAGFGQASFDDRTWFINTQFEAEAEFSGARFRTDVFFNDARLEQPLFLNARFEGAAVFDRADLNKRSTFTRAVFNEGASFKASTLGAESDFSGASSSGSVDFAGASFQAPPLLSRGLSEQASFDNVSTKIPSLFVQLFRPIDSLLATRFRRFKVAAIKDSDNFSEHDFFVGELVGRILSHHGRFSVVTLCGLAYEAFSNFGRSVLLPALWWCLGVVFAAMFYFHVHMEMKPRPVPQIAGAVPGPTPDTFLTSWWYRAEPDCVVDRPQLKEERGGPKTDKRTIEVIGLSAKLRGQTDAAYEALQLALRDGFLILYGDADTAHRTYGCLYGIELYGGGNPVAIVPSQVGFWSAVHKLYSALMIFLFGLALRNMLKMK